MNFFSTEKGGGNAQECLPVVAAGALDFADCDRLMIVAHPDDETLWGGGKLLTGGWFVVCITNCKSKIRSHEFERVMEFSGNAGVMYGFWDGYAPWRKKTVRKLTRKLSEIVGYRTWKKIVTHNRWGEYGHPQHKRIHRIVTAVCEKLGALDRLSCFGRYYSKKKLAKIKASLPCLSEEIYAKKLEMIGFYKSQRRIGRHAHIVRYERLDNS
ncbi:MAG: PIG-L family deacetylase [Firmicutes bacterium]|nr:PIG-L family deacetylase [Bacillota bacterium]